MSGLRTAKRVDSCAWNIGLALFVTAAEPRPRDGVPGRDADAKAQYQVRDRRRLSVEPMSRIALGVETQAIRRPRRRAPRGTGLKVLAALSQAGIDRAKMKTSSYRVSPVYSTRQDKQNVIIGYKAETTISVETADLSSVAALVDAAMAAGANAVRSISYERKDKQAFKAQLIQAACTDAKMKADAAAAALGARVGAPVSVDIQDSFSARQTANVMMMKAAASPDFLSPGELDVSVSVSIEFDLRVE